MACKEVEACENSLMVIVIFGLIFGFVGVAGINKMQENYNIMLAQVIHEADGSIKEIVRNEYKQILIEERKCLEKPESCTGELKSYRASLNQAAYSAPIPISRGNGGYIYSRPSSSR